MIANSTRRPAPPRILAVSFRSNHGRRVNTTVYVKVPYGGIFALSEVLARALSASEILWYRIDRVKDITPEIRAALKRWPEALAGAAARTGVNWNV